MSYTPGDILDYILNNDLEADFLVALACHKNSYSITEIADASFIFDDNKYFVKSRAYDVYTQITDEEIVAALKVGRLVSVFISRNQNAYQLHFMIQSFSKEEKCKHEDELAHGVVQYMIFKTILALRLDTPEKIKAYLT